MTLRSSKTERIKRYLKKSIVYMDVNFSNFTDKALDKSKLKYQRSFLDWEAAEREFTRADSDKEVSRNDVSIVRVHSKLTQTKRSQGMM